MTWTLDDTANLIRKHEGCRFDIYRDTVGVLTVGYGHALHEGSEVSLQVVNHLFDEDFRKAWEQFESLSIDSLKGDGVRSAVVISMIFNLGFKGFLRFKKTIRAIYRGDWFEASVEMLDSKWAIQIGYRAVVLSEMMRTGATKE